MRICVNRLFLNIATAIKVLHENKVVHRDIKPENVLICKDGSIKLCDFGISRKLEGDEYIDDASGTPAYMAPEVLSGQNYEPYSADLWSVGILLFTLLNGAPPFKTKDKEKLKAQIMLGEIKFMKDISDQAKDLCKQI